MEDTVEKGVGPQQALTCRQGPVRVGKGRQVECGGGVYHRDAGKENLSQPWVHMVSGKDFVEIGNQFRVESLSGRM